MCFHISVSLIEAFKEHRLGITRKVSYCVESVAFFLYLVIAQAFYAVIIEGLDGLSEWVHDRTHQDTNIIADLISDCGFIEQHITKSSSYYIVVGNVYLNEVKINCCSIVLVQQQLTSKPVAFGKYNSATLRLIS
ncbi:hypothetical protein Bca4012_039791 [Brassica carinata]